jgi:hypothetical protein
MSKMMRTFAAGGIPAAGLRRSSSLHEEETALPHYEPALRPDKTMIFSSAMFAARVAPLHRGLDLRPVITDSASTAKWERAAFG